MLYHVCQLSVNLPLLDKSRHSTSGLTISAQEICDSSVDIILSIFRRYKNQHPLELVSLIFVQGAVLAAETILTRHAVLNIGQRSLSQNPNLRALDEVFGDMSSTWEIAGIARSEMHMRIGEDANTLLTPGPMGLETTINHESDFGGNGTASQIDLWDVGNVYDFKHFNCENALLWNPGLTVGDSLTWQNVNLEHCFQTESSIDVGYGLSQF